MHQVEGLVDVFQAHGVGDERIQRNLAFLGHFHVARQLAAATHATERRATPDPAGHQLERPGSDFLAGTGHADDHRLAPPFVAAFQGSTHQLHVTDTFEGEVHATVGQVDNHFLDRAVVVFRVDAVGGAQLTGDLELGRVDVDGDDARGLGLHRTDHCRQADAAEAEDGHGVTRLDLGGVEHGTDTGSHAAAQQADLFQRGFFLDLGHRDFRQHRVLGEGRGAHVVEQLLAFVGEARGAVRHQALALGSTDRLAQVGLARQAELALAAFRGVQRDHVVAHGQRGHALAYGFDDRTAFMAKNGWEDALRVGTRQGVGVGVADTAGDHAQQHFTGLGHGHVDFDDFQGFLGFEGYSSTGLDHRVSPDRVSVQITSVIH